MKRSGGVTALAIILIVIGSLWTLASLVGAVIGPQAFKMQREQFAQMLDKVPVGTGEGKVSAEELAQARYDFEQAFDGAQRRMSSPLASAVTFATPLLAIAVVIAGVGILLLRSWARVLIIWQAGLSVFHTIVQTIWSISVQRDISEAILSIMAGGASEESMQQAMRMSQMIGIGAAVLFAVIWNGFIIWFFCRRSVKAQFVAQPSVSG